MNAAEVVETIWRLAEPTVFMSRQEFVDSLNGWDIVPRVIDGEVAGATLTRGPEFHFVSFGLKKPIPPDLMLECLEPILSQHGFVTTRTPKEDLRQHRFNRLIGFYVESTDEYFSYFRLEKLKLHRKKTCLS